MIEREDKNMNFRNRAIAAVAAGALVVAIGLVTVTVHTHAAVDAKSVIDNRRQTMKKMGEHMKAINDFLENDVGEASAVTEHAKAIVDTSKHIPELFPAGTSLADGHGIETGAKPEIWTDRATFEQAAQNMGKEAEKLADAAGSGDKQVIAAAFTELGKEGCGGCHSKFRQKLN
jgi:cytochrome c556